MKGQTSAQTITDKVNSHVITLLLSLPAWAMGEITTMINVKISYFTITLFMMKMMKEKVQRHNNDFDWQKRGSGQAP